MLEAFLMLNKSYFYMACKKCLHATTAGFQFEYTCNMCLEKQLAEPRCRFEAQLTDASGTITATLFGAVVEAILGLSPTEAMGGVSQEYLQQRDDSLSKKKYIVQIKVPKLKHHELTPKYTITTCVEEDSPALQQDTGDASSVTPKAVATNSGNLCETTTLEETPATALKGVAPETPPELHIPLAGCSGSKAKLSLASRFDEPSVVPKAAAKKRRT